ncbi:MAG: phospholipase D family protein [Motiliproteus sp.]
MDRVEHTGRRNVWFTALLVLTLFAGGCATHLPQQEKRSTYYYQHTGDAALARIVNPLLDGQPSLTRVLPLIDGLEAYAARLAAIDQAQYSIDLQTYIFRKDKTGRYLVWSLLRAAERGVRVRILLDDFSTRGIDRHLAMLSHHPNIHIRLFNPFENRIFRGLEMLGSFSRLNRRMHNKSMTVDNLLSIVGGRNVGDEYFKADNGLSFSDVDLMTIGPVVSDVSKQFDKYWNSEITVEIQNPDIDLESSSRARLRLEALALKMQRSRYGIQMKDYSLSAYFEDPDSVWYRGDARLLFDEPDKVLSDPDDLSRYMIKDVRSAFDRVKHSVLFISPYFIPGPEGTERIVELVSRGVEVVVVTNSLAATDVVAVHSGYSRYRSPLLSAGVKIHEVRVNPGSKPAQWFASSRASLHAKTFVLDHRWVFVGSSNFDPRSIRLNTEMGLLIDSPSLARAINTRVTQQLQEKTYRLSLTAGDKARILWHDDVSGESWSSEPDASIFRKIGAAFWRLLPVEDQL